MNKKYWIIAGVLGGLAVLLLAVGAIGLGGWIYLKNRSSVSEHSFRDREVELAKDIRNATKDRTLTDEAARVIIVGDGGGVHIGKDLISADSKTKDRLITDKLSAWKTPTRPPGEQRIYVAVDRNLDYLKAVEVLRVLADNGFVNIGLVAVVEGEPASIEVQLLNKSEIVPIGSGLRSPGPEMIQRPNPLTLVLAIGSDRRLRLNAEPTGSLDNANLVTEKLSQIFRERENNGVFRIGTNEIEKTLHIKASTANTFFDFIRTVDAAKGGGAAPIILQLQDLPPN